MHGHPWYGLLPMFFLFVAGGGLFYLFGLWVCRSQGYTEPILDVLSGG